MYRQSDAFIIFALSSSVDNFVFSENFRVLSLLFLSPFLAVIFVSFVIFYAGVEEEIVVKLTKIYITASTSSGFSNNVLSP